MVATLLGLGVAVDYGLFLNGQAPRATRPGHVVFASFILNDQPAVKMLAVGMAVAVLIDASLVRIVLVPAIMSLLGAHAWWMPGWLEPRLPQLHLEGSPGAEQAEPAVAHRAASLSARRRGS